MKIFKAGSRALFSVQIDPRWIFRAIDKHYITAHIMSCQRFEANIEARLPTTIMLDPEFDHPVNHNRKVPSIKLRHASSQNLVRKEIFSEMQEHDGIRCAKRMAKL